MELSSFSIREYTKGMRSASKDKCWPFDLAEEEEGDKPLPSMEVRKFRWWAHELDRKVVVKQRSPKKRSITELFATAPQITRSEGSSEDQTEEMRKIITDVDDADMRKKKKKSKGKKRKLTSESANVLVEGESDEQEEAIEERKKRKKKSKRKKKKVEIHHHQINLQSKFNAGELEESQMETCSGCTKEYHEGKTLNHATDAGADDKNLREEPDEAFIPLISILKKCKKNKSHAKKGKGVTFSGVDAVLGPDCIVNPSVPQNKNEDKDTSRKCLIDLNEALPEPIDLNSCSEDYEMETCNNTGTIRSPRPEICHSSVETWSLPFNSPHRMSQTGSGLNKNCAFPTNLNSDLSAYATSSEICTEQPRMVPQTVRLMGKDVTVVAANLKSANTGSKAQEAASSSHASCSYYSDGANNQNNGKLDNRSCLEMNFGSGQYTPGNYLAGNYITANSGPVISFPVVPGFNIYHPQFPVLSPPMISFPLGSSVFPQPYGLNFSGFRDGSNNNRDKSCRKSGFMN